MSDPRVSVLYPLQEEARAHFTQFAGWKIADHYGDPAAEHLHVRDAAGLIDLSHRGKIKVTGSDRKSFLHAMMTNDVENLRTGEGLYAMMLNDRGRIVADLYLYSFSDFFLIDCSAALTAKIMETLNKFIIMEDVILKDVTGDHTFIALEGRKAVDFMPAHFGKDLPQLGPNAHATLRMNGFDSELIRTSLSGEEGFAFLTGREHGEALWNFFLSGAEAARIKPFGRAAANSLRIEAGIPWYGADMDERYLLPETGIEQAVSYTKGCYIGQEVVARLQGIAQIQKKLMGLEIGSKRNLQFRFGLTVPAQGRWDRWVRNLQFRSRLAVPAQGRWDGLKEVPEAGSKITSEGEKAGHITSACFSPVLDKAIALGYLNREHWTPGRALDIESGGKKLQARVVSLPFLALRKT